MNKLSPPKDEILVSFLIPTRKRLGMLRASLASLRDTCSDPSNFEAIVIFDEDDVETIDSFKKLYFDFQVKLVVSKRYGYYGLHHYLNNAYKICSGKWFWLWNDDLKMVGKNWDLVIQEYGDKFLILNPGNINPQWKEYCIDATISPVVPAKWFEILGRFSAYSQYDTYVNSVAYPLNLVVNESRLLNNHEQVLDEVSAGISYERNRLPVEESQGDQKLLRAYLGKKVLAQYWLERIPYRLSKYYRRRVNHFHRLFSWQYLSSRLNSRHIMNKIKQSFLEK